MRPLKLFYLGRQICISIHTRHPSGLYYERTFRNGVIVRAPFYSVLRNKYLVGIKYDGGGRDITLLDLVVLLPQKKMPFLENAT